MSTCCSAPRRRAGAPALQRSGDAIRRARARIDQTNAASYVYDLKMAHRETYEKGGHAYATMPTDALATFRDALLETEAYGFDGVRDEQTPRHSDPRTARSAW